MQGVTDRAGVGLFFMRDGERHIAAAEGQTRVAGAVDLQPMFSIPEDASVAAASHDGRLIGTASANGVRLWDGMTGAARGSLDLPTGERINAIAFAPDGTRIAGAGQTGAIHIWDLETRDWLCAIDEHDDYVHHVVFSDDGTRLASVSGDHTAHLFDRVPFAERQREREIRDERRGRWRSTVAGWRADGIAEADIATRLNDADELTSADRRVLFGDGAGG